jgi:hypothetical protein
VLTDLREGIERIAFSEGLAGWVSIRDAEGKLVLEMRKEADKPVIITLPPDGYTVTLDDGVSLKRTTLVLNPGADIEVRQDDFRRVYREPGVVRGDRQPAEEQVYDGVDVNIVCVREGSMDGVQLGLVGNVLEGDMDGIQISSVFNIIEGDLEGVQLAGVFNLSEGPVEGPQVAGVFNITEGSVEGPQVAGVFNIAEGRLEGPQIAGVFNMVEGNGASGIQLASTFNVVEDFEGTQMSVVNVAGRMTGVQIGVVNISDELHGVPIGLVRSERDDKPRLPAGNVVLHIFPGGPLLSGFQRGVLGGYRHGI